MYCSAQRRAGACDLRTLLEECDTPRSSCGVRGVNRHSFTDQEADKLSYAALRDAMDFSKLSAEHRNTFERTFAVSPCERIMDAVAAEQFHGLLCKSYSPEVLQRWNLSPKEFLKVTRGRMCNEPLLFEPVVKLDNRFWKELAGTPVNVLV